MEDVGKTISNMMRGNNYQGRYQEMVAAILKDPDVQDFLHENQERLTQEDIEKSYSKLYEFVKEKRKFQLKDPTMIAPGYEPRLTLNYHYVDVSYVPTDELLAQREQEEIKKRIQTYDIPKDIRNATMKTVSQTAERTAIILQILQFVEDYSKAPGEFHKGLYLAGDVGRGKTYLLGAMANELAKRGFETMLVHYPTFSYNIKRSIGDNTVNEKMDPVRRAPILVLDDVGADAITSWTRDEIFGVILQYRMQEQLPTFFTSNMTMAALEGFLTFSKDGDEPLKAKRLVERIRYLAKEEILQGPNLRNP
ncbi:primosomal protein DnaI [Candidatus Enterococcus leclercqii]|uniref:primosomal protein DnaI n=1 Tax=Candidatus Enterococcus leclercqii TaxID=1857218 RepID=UPI00137B7F68|nr:primosomal protein DnaI [Enterococcus sp. CU9D]KAF1292137.1 primosomal protein DnaI [Enterococcus sp. CU9D]